MQNMKNNIAKLALIPLLAGSLTACNEADFLNKVNPNIATEGTFWVTAKNLDHAMGTIYSPIRNQCYGYFGAHTGYLIMTSRGDDVFLIPNEDGDIKYFSTFTNTPNMDGGSWSDMYKGIQRANVFLANVDKVPDVAVSPDEKNVWKAEASFMRGMYYFLLASNYGNVPLHLTPVNKQEDTFIAATPEQQVWEQVEKDFTFAATYLPVERISSQIGRATRGAALAYLGKAYVFQGKHDKAKVELSKLLSAPYTYDLMDDPYDNFKPDTKFNKESVFEIAYNPQFGGSGTWGSEEASTCQGMVLPTYLGPEGTGAWFKMAPAPFAVKEFIKELRPANSDSKFDKRMYITFYFNQNELGDTKPYENNYEKTFAQLWETPSKGKLSRDPDNSYKANPKIDGVQVLALGKKYTNFFGKSNDAMYTPSDRDNNLRVFRFAEVLLLHAEACAQTNDMVGANTDLKRIRERAGLAYKDFSTASKEVVMKEIEHQKTLEFCMEGQRFYDIRRWYTAAQAKQHFIECGKVGGENFQEKYFYYPINEGEMNNNPSIDQHPLWK